MFALGKQRERRENYKKGILLRRLLQLDNVVHFAYISSHIRAHPTSSSSSIIPPGKFFEESEFLNLFFSVCLCMRCDGGGRIDGRTDEWMVEGNVTCTTRLSSGMSDSCMHVCIIHPCASPILKERKKRVKNFNAF